MPIHGISATQLIAAGREYYEKLKKHGEVKDDKKVLLKLIRSKLNGNHTASELDEPLEYSSRCKTSAVLVVTSAIDINGIKVTKLASKLLMKSAGLSLDSLSHWALVAVDRGEGTCYLYDLMSDQMLPTTKIMKNYPSRYISEHPRYNLFEANCQNLAEALVMELCNGKVISQSNLGEEVKMLSTRMSSTLLMKMSLDRNALRELKSDIKTAGDRLIAAKGSKAIHE
ncbi:hypothetical protein SLS64_001441 [Diaporthe eres]|uniref:PPPDE domain-containing protein n=1 Tax=Diaporthe eres TaxID=83184 RepID=A0ABR1NRT5_DIAER